MIGLRVMNILDISASDPQTSRHWRMVGTIRQG